MTDEYSTLRLQMRGSVLHVVIDNPPLNVLDRDLRGDLDRLSRQLVDETEVKVVLLRSADPEFFIAHADVTGVIGRRVAADRRSGVLGEFHTMVERWRTLPQVTVAELRGAARGGGLEFLMSLDMVFADEEHAVVGLPEVALGIIPGGSGTQRLARVTTRGRALEFVLTSDDLDAPLAERWGIITRALPSAELTRFVDRLVDRMCRWPAASLRLAKQAVDAAWPSPVDGLLDEYHYFTLSLTQPGTDDRLSRFLERGGQQRDSEMGLGARLPAMLDD